MIRLCVEVRHGDVRAGEADFSLDDFGRPYCQHAETSGLHRRRGIASAAYVFAERVFGRPVSNFWDGDDSQSSAAKAMWANPSRPFGRRVGE